MIDWDNGPASMMIWILLVYTAPFIYSFYVDETDEDKPNIGDYG